MNIKIAATKLSKTCAAIEAVTVSADVEAISY